MKPQIYDWLRDTAYAYPGVWATASVGPWRLSCVWDDAIGYRFHTRFVIEGRRRNDHQA